MAKGKRIIIISSFWTGIRDFFLKGEERFKGMPAFTNTFLKILDHPDIDIVYVLFQGQNIDDEYVLPNAYQNKIKVYGYSYSNSFSGLWAIIRLSFRAIGLVIFKKIHVIYGHGPASGLAGLIGNFTGTPNVRRIYGTFLCDKLEESRFNIFRKHPLEYLAFSLPAKAVVITNDGTKGDLVFNKIGHKKSKLNFWLNGIDKTIDNIMTIEEVASKYDFDFTPEICYIARIDIWKRQHLLVNALKIAAKKGKIYNTIIAGPVIDRKYYDSLLKIILDSEMEENVKLIPGLTKEESLSTIKNSKISVSFYDFSNLGNVFLESLSLGTPMLTQNINGSLDLIDHKVYYDTNPMEPVEVANTLENIFGDTGALSIKSKQAIDFSHKHLLTWDERATKELMLLELNKSD